VLVRALGRHRRGAVGHDRNTHWSTGRGAPGSAGILTALVNFLIIAATLFVIVRSFEELQKRRRASGEVAQEEVSDEVVLLAEIRDLLRARQDLT